MDFRLRSTRTTPLLWEFLISILQDKECQSMIRWTDKSEMAFRIVNSTEVARLWGEIKGKPKMNENKLRRAIRQYYISGVMRKVKGQKGGYKFEKLPYNPLTHQDNDTKLELLNEGFSNKTDANIEYNFEDLLTYLKQDEDNNEEQDHSTIFNRNSIHMLQNWMEEQTKGIFCLANSNNGY